jgi:hypothetical protein
MSDQRVARILPKHSTTLTQNKRIHRHPCLEWDSNPRSQESERTKTVDALNRSTTVTDRDVVFFSQWLFSPFRFLASYSVP